MIDEVKDDYLISPHFSYYELRCPLTGNCDMDPDFIVKLENLRNLVNRPLVITSGFRSEDHNFKIGGSAKSQHLFGRAVDIKAHTGKEKYELVKAAIQVGMRGIGVYKYHVHVDFRLDNKKQMWVG